MKSQWWSLSHAVSVMKSRLLSGPFNSSSNSSNTSTPQTNGNKPGRKPPPSIQGYRRGNITVTGYSLRHWTISLRWDNCIEPENVGPSASMKHLQDLKHVITDLWLFCVNWYKEAKCNVPGEDYSNIRWTVQSVGRLLIKTINILFTTFI